MDGPCTCFAHVFPLKHRSEQSGVFVPPFWISQLSINENVVSFLHSTCIVECKNPTPSAIVWADLSQKGVQKRHFLCHRKSHFSLANSSSTMPRKQGLGRKHKKGTGIYRDERQLHTHTHNTRQIMTTTDDDANDDTRYDQRWRGWISTTTTMRRTTMADDEDNNKEEEDGYDQQQWG